ncbi:Uncharacterized protein APZ42_024274 [Daphnia magna]|uniref:Uncharacterized protein n=1 Tax=Daphnia magna TaxID=35525 RepID=A0A164UKP1_9CRUS|nr:Uncharacterized protein APZ42_024274 [Daphnia magna]
MPRSTGIGQHQNGLYNIKSSTKVATVFFATLPKIPMMQIFSKRLVLSMCKPPVYFNVLGTSPCHVSKSGLT